MPSLKNPQLQIPGGFQFYVAETKFTPAPFSSLDSIVQQLISHRRGRPDLVAARGWSLDPKEVYKEVLEYQVAVCVRNGWNDYLLGGSEAIVPFPVHTPQRRGLRGRVADVKVGVETTLSWLSDGVPPVAAELSSARATVCVACPLNGKGGWESFFTQPASFAIRKELERKNGMKLNTPLDESLGTCQACSCPLPLLVWVPIEVKLKKLSADVKTLLHPSCWVLSEEKALTQPN